MNNKFYFTVMTLCLLRDSPEDFGYPETWPEQRKNDFPDLPFSALEELISWWFTETGKHAFVAMVDTIVASGGPSTLLDIAFEDFGQLLNGIEDPYSVHGVLPDDDEQSDDPEEDERVQEIMEFWSNSEEKIMEIVLQKASPLMQLAQELSVN